MTLHRFHLGFITAFVKYLTTVVIILSLNTAIHAEERARSCAERSSENVGWIKGDVLEFGKMKHYYRIATKMIVTYSNKCTRDIRAIVHCGSNDKLLGQVVLPANVKNKDQVLNIEECLRHSINKTGKSIVDTYTAYDYLND